MAEDGYEEQIIIPKEKRELAAQERITTENKQKVTVQIMNLRTGESYIGRLACPPSQAAQARRAGHYGNSPDPPAIARPGLLTRIHVSCVKAMQIGKLDWYGTSGQVYLPTEIQQMLKDSGKVRIQILGG